ncbi:DNA polymerase III subunit delta [Lawsonia intracellularis]|uniref:DNA polymerase III subunit delta n=1 Tax=Lawsonia intracellularis TaxID=29546 RepID=UPI0021E56CC7|nr:hypothetical protein [Lawsonia intracellularis]UYH53084.1 hypothetical protein OCT60_00865 [Lawsonia intracellularis]
MIHQGFIFCICPDSTILQQQLEELVTAQYVSNKWEKSVYWGDEELPKKFWDNLTLQNLFTNKQIVVLRNAHLLPVDIWKNISSIISKPNQYLWLIFCLEALWEKRQPKLPAHIQKLPCFIFAQKQKWIWSSPGVDERNLKQFIKTQATSIGLTFEPHTLETLSNLLPTDAATIKSELLKIKLSHSDSLPISTQQLNVISHTANTFDIFIFLKQLESGNALQVWTSILHEQQKEEDPLFFILTMLQREAKTLWQLLMGETVTGYPNELSKKTQLAKYIGIKGITKMWDALYFAEVTVKSGEGSSIQALETLISTLLPLFTKAQETS